MATGRKTGGRRKGTGNKRKGSFREELRAYCATLGVDPHHFMADLIADTATVHIGVTADGTPIVAPAVGMTLKLQAARELAQYLEPKLKAVEHSGDIAHTVRVIKHRYGHQRDRD